jgi:hypothetical protein
MWAKLVVSVEVNFGGVSADETGGLSLIKHGRSDHTRRATIRGAIVGGIDAAFVLKVSLTLIVRKSICTDVDALKCVRAVR